MPISKSGAPSYQEEGPLVALQSKLGHLTLNGGSQAKVRQLLSLLTLPFLGASEKALV